MVLEIDVFAIYVPEQMGPGALHVFNEPEEAEDKNDPHWGILACPTCGLHGRVSRTQLAGLKSVICGSNQCPAEFYIRGENIVPRVPS